MLQRFLPVCFLLPLSGWAAAASPVYTSSGHDKCETAVPVSSVAAEYEYLRANHPGFTLSKQELRSCNGTPVDVLVVLNHATLKYTYLVFDISSFFGKY